MTTPNAVKQIVFQSPYLTEGLSRDLINVSSLARDIKVEVENIVFKDVSIASIVTALQRLSTELRYNKVIDYRNHLGSISVRSDISELTFRNSDKLIKILRQLTREYEGQEEIYFSYIKGIWQATLIFDSILMEQILKLSKGEEILYKYENLSTMTIRLVRGHLDTPGVIAHVLHLLAWKGINLIEVVSTADELTVVLENNSVDEAFSTINNYKLRSH